METTSQTTAATACPTTPALPTPEAVAAFFEAACAGIKKATGNPYVSSGITVTSGYGATVVEWCTYADGCHHVRRQTFEEAMAEIITSAGPTAKAAALRIQAKELTEKAERIEAFAATPLPSDVTAEVMPEGRQLPGKSTNIHE